MKKISTETAYFISSLKCHADTIAQCIRDHWANRKRLALVSGYLLSWKITAAVRKDHAPENLGILRHMAINLLKKEKSLKGGIQTKRLKAAWDHDYLLKSLALKVYLRLPCRIPRGNRITFLSSFAGNAKSRISIGG